MTRVRRHVYTLPDIPGCTNTGADSKIDLLDPADLVLKKVKKAFAAPKEVEGNGVLALIEYVLLPVSLLKTGERKFVVERERDGLEPLVYTEISKLHEDYRNEVVWASSRALNAESHANSCAVDTAAGEAGRGKGSQ